MATQVQMFWQAHRQIADANEAMLDMLFGVNPITDDELRALIAKRPEKYERFAGYLGKRSFHETYNVKNFPTFVCHHGNWDIYRNAAGHCAALPTVKAASQGCRASHFGDHRYVQTTLGVRINL